LHTFLIPKILFLMSDVIPYNLFPANINEDWGCYPFVPLKLRSTLYRAIHKVESEEIRLKNNVIWSFFIVFLSINTDY